jgi:hypothetical protein
MLPTVIEPVVEIQCPFCWQSFEIVVEATTDSQCFTTDCEVCCRPLEVVIVCEAGEVVSVQVDGG